MAIYVFNLLIGYYFSGVDSGLGKRNKFLEKSSHEVKYVFTQKPTEEYVQRYIDAGININQMLSVNLFLANNYDMSGDYLVVDKLDEIKQVYGDVRLVEHDDAITLYKDGMRFATIKLKPNKKAFWRINYFESERLIASEFYAGQLLYTDHYITVNDENKVYAKLVRTSFVDKKGNRVYDYIYDENGSGSYVFRNGMRYTEIQGMYMCFQELNFSEKDTVLIDRPAYLNFVQPLFQVGNKAKIMVFLHSGHYFEPGEDPASIYLSYEYLYWFKYSHKIDMFLVSTEEQKKDLQVKLLEYNCYVPNIEVVPIGGLKELKYPKEKRKRHSLVTVSRLAIRKRVEWTILSVIEAHKYNPEINLDIYGEGEEEYESYLKKIVEENHAEDYIRFMGFADVTEIYQNYEVYISASTWETFGLSVLEAIGSGNAVIGLDVRYGNRLFIQNDKNGKLVDFQCQEKYDSKAVDEVVGKMANAIIEVFKDDEKLQKYHERSYEIAEQFLDEKIERKWLELFKESENHDL